MSGRGDTQDNATGKGKAMTKYPLAARGESGLSRVHDSRTGAGSASAWLATSPQFSQQPTIRPPHVQDQELRGRLARSLLVIGGLGQG